MPPPAPSFIWLRDDLRLADNEALRAVPFSASSSAMSEAPELAARRAGGRIIRLMRSAKLWPPGVVG